MTLRFAGAGVVTAAGGCFEQTASSIRAGIIRLNLISVDDDDPENLLFCARVEDDYLPTLKPRLDDQLADWPRTARCLRLAHLALKDFDDGELDGIPLVLALPEPIEGLEDLPENLPELLNQQTGAGFSGEHCRVYAYGQAGGLAAFHAARILIQQGISPRVLVGGVDCRSQASSMARFQHQNRALYLGAAHGYVPGEGAGFVLLESATENADEVVIHEPGFAQQKMDQPEIGEQTPDGSITAQAAPGKALGEAMVSAAENCRAEKISTIISPLSGELRQTQEWADACRHLADYTSMAPDLIHPAHQIGDLGAAHVPVTVALAAHGLNGSYLRPPILVCGVSDGSYRAAAIVDLASKKQARGRAAQKVKGS